MAANDGGRMRGVSALRLALSSVGHTHDELIVLARAIRNRDPKDLEAVYDAVSKHLAATEQLEAHVRMMIARESEAPFDWTAERGVPS